MEPRRYGPFPYTPITERPELRWPNRARLALWIVPNIEFFPLNEKVFFGAGFLPDVLAWSVRDYGARVGIFRIMEVLDKYGIRGTVALNSDVCDAYPQIIEEAKKRSWKFMGHNQSNSRPLNQIPPETEQDVIFATFKRIEQATGARPRGWLSGGLIPFLGNRCERWECHLGRYRYPKPLPLFVLGRVDPPGCDQSRSKCNAFGRFNRWTQNPWRDHPKSIFLIIEFSPLSKRAESKKEELVRSKVHNCPIGK